MSSVSRRPGDFSDQDLYIRYQEDDGGWNPAINLGEEINTVGDGAGWPHLSIDGKYLFFVAGRNPYSAFDGTNIEYEELREIDESLDNGLSKLYWVSTGFIEKLRP